MLFGGMDELECNQLEATFLKTANDLRDKSALHTIRLDRNKSAFGSHF